MIDKILVLTSACLWCFLHSWYISHPTQARLQAWLGRYHAFSRLFFVLCSTISFLALVAWWQRMEAETLFAWPGWWQPVRWAGLAVTGALMLAGARIYDNREFLGLRQLRGFSAVNGGGRPQLSRTGILRFVRHPYYTGAFLLLIFCLPLTDINAIWRLVFFVYTAVGTELEERKLRREFKDEYLAYQKEVPRFLPRLWK